MMKLKPSTLAAAALAALGDSTQAFEYLERSIELGEYWLMKLRMLPCPCPPSPIQPMVMRSLGATAPPRPSTLAGTIIGAAAPSTNPPVRRRKFRRFMAGFTFPLKERGSRPDQSFSGSR